jgi:hypothetical protein
MNYELDLTPGDIGEIITIIRVQHFKIHVGPFAEALGVKEKVLLSAEEGLGPHGMLILKKINQLFPSVQVTINVKLNEKK